MDSIQEMSVVIALGAAVTVVVTACGCLRREALAKGPRRDLGLGAIDLALGLAVMCLGILALAAVGMRLGLIPPGGQEDAVPTPQKMVAMAFLNQAVVQLPVVLLLLVRAGGHPGSMRALGLWPRRPGRDVGLGVAGLFAALPMVTATTALAVIVGLQFDQPPPEVGHDMLRAMVEAGSRWLLWAMLVSAVVVAPVLEELIFRGLLQTALLGMVGFERRWLVVIMSAVVFALVHAGTPWQVKPGLFVLGVVLGWLYERTGSLWPGVIVHAGFNGVNSALALLVSGAG